MGGFFGHPEDELMVRWYQAAAYQTFFRSHAHEDSPRREPYLLPEPSRSIVRKALKARYALLPFWYTMFYEHERFGSPVMRPMLAEYPLDTEAFNIDNQYMLSDKLLVRPVMEKSVTAVVVHFPTLDGDKKGDVWYDFDNYNKISVVGEKKSINVDMNTVPVYQKGGSIIPKKQTAKKSSVLMIDDPISLFVAIDAEGKAQGTLFIDDEESYEYRHGKYLYLQFEFHNNTMTSKSIDSTSNYLTKSQLHEIIIAGVEKVPTSAIIKLSNGQSNQLEISSTSGSFFIIKVSNVSLNDEWTLTLNGAKKNVIGISLLAMVLIKMLI